MSGVGEAVEPCTDNQESASHECRYGLIQMAKDGTTQHQNILVIDMGQDNSERTDESLTYEVVGGEDSNTAAVSLDVSNIVSTCNRHSDGVVRCQSRPAHFVNSNASNRVELPYNYDNRHPFQNNFKSYRFRIAACQTGRTSFEAKVAPDRKYECEVKAAIGAGGSNTSDFSAGVSVETKVSWNGNEGAVKFGLQLARGRFRWSMPELSGGMGVFRSTFPNRRILSRLGNIRDYADRFKEILEAKENLQDSLMDKFDQGSNANWDFKFEMSGNVKYADYYQEDDQSLLVGRVRELELSGTFLKFELERDITSSFLSIFGPSGRALDVARTIAEYIGAGDFSAKIKLEGAFTINGCAFKNITVHNNEPRDLPTRQARSVEILIVLSFILTGRVRVDTVLHGAELSLHQCGVRCRFLAEQKQIAPQFTGIVIRAIIFHESLSSEYRANNPPPGNLLEVESRNFDRTTDWEGSLTVMPARDFGPYEF